MNSPAQLLPHQTRQNRRSQRTKKSPQVGLSERQEELLQAIHQLRFVTAWDITRLYYTQTSINHVREILSGLSGKKDYAERHYLYRFPLPNTRIGNTEKIYTLGSEGRSYLQSQGMSVDWYFRPYKVAGMTYQNCLHALTLTRFLVAAKVFVKKHPEWELTTIRTEYELKKEIAEVHAKKQAATITLTATNGKAEETVIVIPDAWLLFHNTTSKKGSWHPVFLEIDRATEQQRYFKRQIRARALFLTNGGYKKLFGTNKGVIAYATTGNQTRVHTMRKWTKEVLAELNLKKLSSRFLYCSLTPSWEQDEQRLFLAPLWSRASDKHPVPLLA
ncbi:MAG: replication-relaxation family protein [Ktedonobacteraceae bacterium]